MRDGRIGLILLAAGIAPALIKRSKPMARYVGDHLIKAGEYLKDGTDASSEAAQESVSKKPDVPETAHEVSQEGPLAREEVGNQATAEELGDGAAPEPVDPEPKQAQKNPPSDQTKNPKRT